MIKRRRWTKNEVDYLKDNWGEIHIKEIAKVLNRTISAIQNKAYSLKLGANAKAKNPVWTDKELRYLADNWGTISMEAIANKLGRTEGAVQQKASKEGLGPFLESGDYVTLNVLCEVITGGSSGRTYTIQQWIDKGLPATTKKVKNNSFMVVNLKEFWKWAEKNRTIIDFSKLGKYVLGKEPEWLEEQRKADKENAYFKRTPWTKSEDNILKRMLNEYRYTYRDLSLRLRRTEGAIKRRMLDLGIKVRPIKMSNHNYWSEDEIKTLIDLYNSGHSRNTMPNYINRSSQACSGKIERLIKEGILEPRSKFRKSC